VSVITRRSFGRQFHSAGPEKEKARSANFVPSLGFETSFIQVGFISHNTGYVLTGVCFTVIKGGVGPGGGIRSTECPPPVVTVIKGGVGPGGGIRSTECPPVVTVIKGGVGPGGGIRSTECPAPVVTFSELRNFLKS